MRQTWQTMLMGMAAVILTSTLAWADTPVVFRAHNYGFSGPDRIHGGMTTMQIVNEGQDAHHIQLLRLWHGKTAEDVRLALAASPHTFPSWVTFVGGSNAALPGAQAPASMWLPEGHYVLICLIPNQQGLPHVALGMQKALTVVRPRSRAVSGPRAEATLTQEDFAFGLSGAITPGTRTIRVLNRGAQPHEVVLVKLAPGGSARDLADAIISGSPGPLPGTLHGGVVGIEPGAEAYFTADFEPGRYGVMCFFPDHGTGAMHYRNGMTLEFVVP